MVYSAWGAVTTVRGVTSFVSLMRTCMVEVCHLYHVIVADNPQGGEAVGGTGCR